MTHFEFDATHLLTVLKQRYFAVPRYQRSYSWDEEEYSDFWDDIFQATRANREYFLGTIVLSQETLPGEESIIDGQQRLATTTILLSAIRDHYRNSDDHAVRHAGDSIHRDFLAPYDSTTFQEKQRLRLNPTDNVFYYENILSNKNQSSNLRSHQRMQNAKLFFQDKIEKIKEENPNSWTQIISSLHAFLGQQARVVVVRASSNQDAFTIFETLNDRGADLTIADLLKNYLFSTAAHEIDHVQERWTEAGALLNIHQDNRKFIVFLRHLWSSMHGTTRERDLYRRIKDRINDHPSAIRFANQISEGARIYEVIVSGDVDSLGIMSEKLQNAMHALTMLDLEQNRPLLLAMFKHFTRDELEITLSKLLAWSIRGIVVGGIGGGQAERMYCDAAVAIRDGSIKDHNMLLAALQRIIPSQSLFYNALVYERAPKAMISRYMLLEIERHLRGEEASEHVPNPDKEEVNLEHILPKNAKTQEWKGFNSEEVPLNSSKFGNLTLLRKNENNRIGNKSWDFKKAAFSKSSLALNTSLAKTEGWNEGEIEARGRWLAGIALEVWKL